MKLRNLLVEIWEIDAGFRVLLRVLYANWSNFLMEANVYSAVWCVKKLLSFGGGEVEACSKTSDILYVDDLISYLAPLSSNNVALMLGLKWGKKRAISGLNTEERKNYIAAIDFQSIANDIQRYFCIYLCIYFISALELI